MHPRAKPSLNAGRLHPMHACTHACIRVLEWDARAGACVEGVLGVQPGPWQQEGRGSKGAHGREAKRTWARGCEQGGRGRGKHDSSVHARGQYGGQWLLNSTELVCPTSLNARNRSSSSPPTAVPPPTAAAPSPPPPPAPLGGCLGRPGPGGTRNPRSSLQPASCGVRPGCGGWRGQARVRPGCGGWRGQARVRPGSGQGQARVWWFSG
jgi:hypothetical protein